MNELRLCFAGCSFRRMAMAYVGLACGILPGAKAQQSTQGEPYRLQVEASLVLVDVAAEWKRTGKPLMGLSAADFEIDEDGRPQSINSASQDVLPLSIVFVFDLTDTVHPVLQHLANGAAEVLRPLRAEDEVAVVTASSHTRLEQRFTRDRMAAVEGIDAASASYDRSEPTFLFEDLWQAVQVSESSRAQQARRVQIWLTDGSANDQDTQRGLAKEAPAVLHTEAQAREALLRSGVAVSVLMEQSQLRGSGRFGDLERFAEETGGPVVAATAADARGRLAALLDALRARYTLGYRPAEPKPVGTVCRLAAHLSPAFFAAHPEVKAKDVVVRARRSYLRGAQP